MKRWNRTIIESKYITIIVLIAFFLTLYSFYSSEWQVFFLAIVLFGFSWFNQRYLKKAGEGLFMINNKIRNKYFIGKEGEWKLEFHNNGYPIIGAEIRIFFNSVVSPKELHVDSKLSTYEMKIPFSINWKQKKTVVVPFYTDKRGVSRIRKLEIYIPSYLGLGKIILENDFFLMQEVVVYPKTMEVKNKQILQAFKTGNMQANDSIFEDYLSPSGTREYLYSDNFNRIHWKASARNQQLQTKVFDRVSENGWHLSIQIRDIHYVTTNLERILSAVTDLAYFFTKENVIFSISFNLFQPGSIPFIYVAPGKGREHLQKVLETIALVDIQAPIYPYVKMIDYYSRHIEQLPFLLQGGVSHQEVQFELNSLLKKGVQVFEIEALEQYAVIAKKTVKKGMIFS